MDDEIPAEVLTDFHNRTVVSVTNLKWDNAEFTSVTGDVLFAELEVMGPVPFTATADADTRHGLEVWANANAGVYGDIAPFVPPTPEELRTAFPRLTARQLRLALASIKITDAEVDAALANDPMGMIEWRWAGQFNRLHPLIDAMGSAFTLSPEQIDSLWQWASGL